MSNAAGSRPSSNGTNHPRFPVRPAPHFGSTEVYEPLADFTDDVTFFDAIEGYAGALSYDAGDRLELHISTTCPHYEVRIERWGATREHVWSRHQIPGQYTPAPSDADASGCRWPVSVDLTIPDTWRSGFYLVTMVGAEAPEGRNTAHAGFVVRSGTPRAEALVVLATNTWNAYNPWGGASLYSGGTHVSYRRPFARGMLDRPATERDDRKARPVRWDEEADVDGRIFQAYRYAHGYPAAIGSAGWYTHERRFIEWAERCGYRVDMAVSTDLEDGLDLSTYAVVFGVGHDEYWSAPMRDAIEAYVHDGGTYASLSGNTMFWQVRREGDGPAATMVSYKYAAHQDDPVQGTNQASTMTGMWADPLIDRPEAAFLGAGSAWGLYHRFGHATARSSGAFTVYRADHWLLAGTDLRYGDLLGARDGVVGYETVGCHLQWDDQHLPIATGQDATPRDHMIVAFAPASNLGVGEYPKSISALSDQGDLEFMAARLYPGMDPADAWARLRHGNAAMVVCRPFGHAGGEVITIGSTDWVFGLEHDWRVATVTANIFDHAGVQPES